MTSCKPGLATLSFTFDDGTPVRTVTGPDGEPWVVATDVCAVLGLQNPTMALKGLDADEVATLRNVEGRAGRGAQSFNIISESGVWALTFKSRKPNAKRFRKWVTKDVIQSIRKTGAYIAPMAAIRQAVAERFLRAGLAKWSKRFPDAFYQEIFRLKGWPWQGPGTPRPGVIAHYTNDLVYERLAPELLRILQERNPINLETGRRDAKHHQHLSDDIGAPGLDRHIHSVICIMKSAASWDDLIIQMDRIHPRWAHNLQLPLMDDLRLLPPDATA
ncbi:P63C domain-containing protein [Myxococcus sp. CA040A]|uniref:P63C domain-containing protein n=1 Tax=Myxococcus sp. CA040A TaxID=2741738 RepID=UPI00157B17F2|nr:P63C domain-containing protein [Myxococcus sp. CA040A]NTX07054.1 hypothetical protein [Myxococcus sp. CA040A]